MNQLELDGVPAQIVKLKVAGPVTAVDGPPSYTSGGYIIAAVEVDKAAQTRDGDGLQVRTVTVTVTEGFFLADDDADADDLLVTARNRHLSSMGVATLPFTDQAGT